MMSNLGWGSLMESPILSAMGTSNTAAMVCEILLISRHPSWVDLQSGDHKGNQRKDYENAVQP